MPAPARRSRTALPRPVVAERYLLLERLGAGGSAVVHRARDLRLEREVAVKLLKVEPSVDQAADRLLAEARTLARLQHPGVIGLLDAGRHRGRPYLVTEVVEGPTLASLARERRALPWPAPRLLGQLAAALAHVHAHDVVHGDVKPSNVILGIDGRARIIDFGIAHRRGHGPDVPVPHGAVLGSPGYLAPEVLAGGASTPAVDVHALGLVMLELLGARPRLSGSVQDVLAARRQAAPLPTGLDPRWRDLLSAMTSPAPLSRPSMRHVVRAAASLPERPWHVDIAPLAMGSTVDVDTQAMALPELVAAAAS